jgi:murein DD-endopeptidase MepM/ murein hydrolase activator NlpD
MRKGKSRIGGTIKTFFYLTTIAVIIGGAIFVIPRFEWNPPIVNLELDSSFIGVRPFNVMIKDKGSGLRRVSIMLVEEGSVYPLIEEDYPVSVREKNITIVLDPKKLGVKEGPATIRVTAVDRSWWRFFRGNQTTLSKNVTIDVTPPRVEVTSREHYINFGGSGLVIFKASSDTVKSGVKVGDYFFLAYKGYFKNPDIYLAFFAYPYNVSMDTRPVVIAEDAAGNSKETGFSYRLKNVKYRKSNLNVSDDFIERKAAPILGSNPSQSGDLKDVFLQVNREIRRKNEADIKKICANSKTAMLWNGAFHQLTNSKVEANFADERTYIYKGETIDHQYHLGYDLAVTEKSPIEAANDGVVAFAGDLGIYGNAVIIDHGFGISTLYAHMSSIGVNVGDTVKKKQIIGRTGDTGLAAGDHLHYAVLVQGIPVLPTEWWDEKWINDKVIGKIKEAEAEFSTQRDESGFQQSPPQGKVQ